MDLYSGAPYWLLRDALEREVPPLDRDEQGDVVVIGAGITGALIADALASAGLDVVVLERRMPGVGSTAASTALLQYEIDVELTDLARRVGEANAIRVYRLGVEAIDHLQTVIDELGGAALFGFERRASLYLASRRRHVSRLKKECGMRRASGFHVEWWDGDRVESTYGFPSHGALCSSDAAEIDALRLTRGVLGRAANRGARIYARTSAVVCHPDGDGATLTTDRGHTVRGRRVVFATGYEVPPVVDRDLVSLHSTYAFVTEPVSGDVRWHGECLVWESARPYFYMRTADDGRIIVGGEDVPFRDAMARDALLPVKTRRLAKRLAEMMPDATAPSAFSWTGTFAETRDGLPYIGPTLTHPSILVALGYGGNGITFSVIASRLLHDLCIGEPNPDIELFRLDR